MGNLCGKYRTTARVQQSGLWVSKGSPLEPMGAWQCYFGTGFGTAILGKGQGETRPQEPPWGLDLWGPPTWVPPVVAAIWWLPPRAPRAQPPVANKSHIAVLETYEFAGSSRGFEKAKLGLEHLCVDPNAP